MTAKVVSMEIPPGIQRDGTVFDAPCFVDGKWVRFQRGRPRKIGGYDGIFLNASGISRGMAMTAVSGFNYVVSGYNNGLQQWVTDTDGGVGSGPYDYTLNNFTASDDNLWQFDIAYDSTGNNTNNLVAHPGQNLTYITSTVNTPVLYGTFPGSFGYLTGVTITGTAGQFSCALSGVTLTVGQQIVISGTFGGTGSITGYTSPTTYFITVTNGSTTFTLSTSIGGTAVVTTAGTPTGLTYTAAPSMSKVGLFTAVGATTSGSNIFSLTASNVRVAAGQSISGAGIPSGTTVKSADISVVNFTASCSGTALTTTGSPALVVGMVVTIAGGTSLGSVVSGSVNSWVVSIGGIYSSQTMVASTTGITLVTMSAAATASATITATFDNNIAVSGGCVVIHPYLFVYGNNGLIQNCSAGDFSNWVSPDANASNVATGKIVKGLPIRGGSTSPSGLFWSADALIRVSFQPSSSGGVNYYWAYDLVSSQTSIMSSSSVIEYDGIFYWVGVDRFLCYNGVVQEIPNKYNENYFFDNLNYSARQKVWATKVPRYGEIWWFYPKGDATECNDAIIYNIREKVFYDAGQALGARRSAGVFSEVFPKPVWAGNEVNSEGTYTLWQHETGYDQIYLTNVDAIQSYFETYSIGTLGGLVGTQQQPGDNLWTRLERIEPDFVQTGDMTVVVTGEGYADDTAVESDPYTFSPNTLKIDMREQRREMRLRFESNTYNGTYQTGRVLLSLTTGDVRSTGNP